MLRIELQFLTGRYHATPWGQHVNEGAIEWPPSPWRIGRALIASGFGKAGWTWMPDVAAHAIMCLASTPPVYYLPSATAAHTRHFMPMHKSASKVLDAFAHPGRAGVMIIEWDLELRAEEISILDTLFGRMSYLGRAESRIAARRVDSVPSGLTMCARGDAPGPDWERVELLALMPMAEFPTWRERMHEREAERRLERKRERARELGKRRPGRLSKILRARLDAELPATALDALCAVTAELHSAGWSQPPGSRWLTYWRPGDALDARPDARGCATMGTSTSTPHRVAVLALDGTGRASSLPRMRDALPRCEALHKALVKHSAELQGVPAPCFTGRDCRRKPLQGHRHTTLMPLALGEVGERMDHIVLYTPMGLDAHAVAALQSLTLTYGKELPRLGVRLIEVGRPEDFAAHMPVFGKARIWESYTPFVPPRYLKASGKNSLAGQVRAELAGRGLPEPVAVQIEIDSPENIRYLDCAEFFPLWKARQRGDGARLSERWRLYRRARQGNASQPPIDMALGLRLLFAEPVQGPVSLGYASHFGMGLFVPSLNTAG